MITSESLVFTTLDLLRECCKNIKLMAMISIQISQELKTTPGRNRINLDRRQIESTLSLSNLITLD